MSADIWARVDEAIDTDPLQLRGIVAELLARAVKAESALNQLRAYARWCKDRAVEPDERDIRELADGTHHEDYVALMAADVPTEETDG